MTREPRPESDNQLEIDGAALRALLTEATQRLAAYLDSTPSQPASASPDQAAAVARELAGLPVTETGTSFTAILDLLFDRVFPAAANTTSPGFFGYFAGGGVPTAAVADLISGVVNRFVGRWASAPAAAQLEVNVLRWFADLIGYPRTARGVLTSGGSLGNLTALFTARQQHPGGDLSSLRLYASEHVHFSIPKSAAICGLPKQALRKVALDRHGRMDLAVLASMIHDDVRCGMRPFMVIASAGTFLTGAIDDLAGVAALAREHNLWFHVDAAYGGFFQLTERGNQLLAGIGSADSVTLDPHKGLFMPYGTGALLVRNGQLLKRAHEVEGDFYGPLLDDGDAIDFCSYSIEQTRPFRGLRVWLPLALHGSAPFRRNLDEKLDLARVAHEELRATPGIEVLAAPVLTVVVFRLAPAGAADGGEAANRARIDHLNQALVHRVNQRGNVFLMNVVLGGSTAVRLCILSFRAHLDRVRTALADIRAEAASLLAEAE